MKNIKNSSEITEILRHRSLFIAWEGGGGVRRIWAKGGEILPIPPLNAIPLK